MKAFTNLFPQIVILGLFWFYCLNLQAQCTCDLEEVMDLPRSEIINRYIPDGFTSIKYVKVNFHFMMKSDSTLNFTPYDDGNGNCEFTAYDYSEILINYANSMLSQNAPMNLPPNNNTPVLSRRYRLKLEGIYFHYDDNAYTFYQQPGSLNQTEITYYSVNANTEINVFFVYKDVERLSEDEKGILGGDANMSGNRYVRINGAWQKYIAGGGNDGFWGDAWTLVHETGHNMSLFHTMQNKSICNDINDYCADTPLWSEILGLGLPDPCPTWNNNNQYMSNNLMDYSGYQVVTPEQLGRIHYTLMHDMLPYLYDDYCIVNQNEPEYVLEAGQDLTWQNDRILKNNLIIENGAKLTLKDCILHVPSGANIIVKPGGQLIVDGATVTNRCGLMWPGIEVWGNSATHQYEINGSYGQGYLELKNGARIENAVCAVELCRPGVPGTSGGIVLADSAFFVNNAKAVHAVNYTNHLPTHGNETSYNAHFNQCTFDIDNGFFGTETFHEHVELDRVNGIVFEGCSFSLDPQATGIASDNHGITADTAGFIVTSFSPAGGGGSPQPYPGSSTDIPSSFTGFRDGIHADNGGNNSRTFSVEDAVFTGNGRGVYAGGASYAAILRNEFHVGQGTECAYGVYVDGAEGFNIEENEFSPWGTTGDTYGVAVFNSAAVNDVYRNTFTGLTCGNLAVGDNTDPRSMQAGARIADGLTYTCNTNTNNGIDFCVLKDNGSGDIRTVQGSPSLSAGNTFGGSVYHFYNDGESTVTYYYDGTVPSRIPNTSLLYRVSANLNSNPNITTNACAEHGGPVVKSAEEKKALAKEYAAAREEYDRLLELLRKTPSESADYEDIAAMAVEQHHAWHHAAGDIVRSNLLDTVADPEELKTWLAVLEEGATPKDRAQGGGRSMTYGCPTLPTGTRGLDKPADTKVNEENNISPHVTVSPNPANTWLNVNYDFPEGNDKAVLVITSAIGTKMAELTLEGHRGSKTIDIRALPAGVYFLSVTIDNGEQYVTKVVRQ